jgi:hypothetical protein
VTPKNAVSIAADKVEIKKALLKDIGPQLPIGLLDHSGNWVKDIATKPWRMKEERELGILRDQNRDANLAQFVGMVLGTMCSKLGAHDLASINATERRVIVSQMFTGDVFYAYIWLRIQALGPELQMALTCPNCSTKFPYTADLNSIEVASVSRLEDALWAYEFKQPFSIRGVAAPKIQMGPARWNGLEMISAGGMNTTIAKAGIIRASIHAVPGKDGALIPIALADGELDDMSKRDLEEITASIDKHNIGPNMSIEGTCSRCRYQFKMPIDWGYDGFFGASGQ